MESILLSATELRFSSILFDISIGSRAAPTSEVRNLPLQPGSWFGNTYLRRRITYNDASGRVSLAAGLDESEALALISVMLAVYPFSMGRSLYRAT
jgi:hypothetical protein